MLVEATEGLPRVCGVSTLTQPLACKRAAESKKCRQAGESCLKDGISGTGGDPYLRTPKKVLVYNANKIPFLVGLLGGTPSVR
jgi:hypothetical protein